MVYTSAVHTPLPLSLTDKTIPQFLQCRTSSPLFALFYLGLIVKFVRVTAIYSSVPDPALPAFGVFVLKIMQQRPNFFFEGNSLCKLGSQEKTSFLLFLLQLAIDTN